MTIQQRFFQLDDQWCIIHVPERPNGFGVLLLGDVNHYVTENASFWTEHEGRRQLLDDLLQYGYTIFSSHLYGRHWGSDQALRLAKQLIYYVLKSEILNHRIYLLAEGMGALAALRLMEEISPQIRAVAMFSPCLNLRAQLEYEKENKFFYKRLVNDIADAYRVDKTKVYDVIPCSSLTFSHVPTKIWQLSGVTPYPSSLHCRKYAEIAKEKKLPVEVLYHLPEKRYRFARAIHQFYEKYNRL
ncbi:hypothetical protein GFC29_3621 [Anoxybacillus sp. B7M1]|jgi:hypothetical protein|uniref:Alpha/beta hydrolase n=1 Tax=Anoxybacteroides rupiense TaxID=311460 RepID=A0ABT5W7E5_9BACL|nr:MULTISPECIES: alpha/beta hydrolase [Anoxybacillus]ANB57344.1 hypothetical protein GFC28_1813 [Anoxybacillus sp. B2M1]ANB62944.1 hypothetical protein GFC29_3621 [Anoxybacillus sp. B7M1]KXG10161.1 hypothetical protein AT864_01722 [Anoxybacillus sp. P3H1B]MBB3907491.1 hypothetical protein [Anoxybacillus rupiensis]MBS2770494.1 alpha/beta hydrolase [Anoxybacillus rupiensis]